MSWLDSDRNRLLPKGISRRQAISPSRNGVRARDGGQLGALAAASARAVRSAMALLKGSGLRSARLVMNAPSMLVTALVASWVARAWGMFFSVRRAARVAITSWKQRRGAGVRGGAGGVR